jgi:hypothetical protein
MHRVSEAHPSIKIHRSTHSRVGVHVNEQRIYGDDVFKSYERGELLECFGTGMAATASHVRRICYKDQTLELPPVE